MSVPIPAVPAILTPAELLVWLLAVCVLVGAAVASVLRFVPNGHTGVVMRFGRVIRTRQPGPALVVPIIERVRMVPSSAAPISPLVVRATTADDVPVIVTARAVVRIDDARQWIAADTVQPAHLVEDAIAHVVGESVLSD
ncbi:SPFH domain-containing protein, partial [Pseudomonas aeruginosa]|uniref:SPFH domain-containing protein n=1 Tax=Pseudomonas aeruginosa TaxID=287 RepID=UPI003002B71C